MQIAEVLSDDIPVGLFALQVQFDQVDENLLERLGQRLRRLEAPFGVLPAGGLRPCIRARVRASFDGVRHGCRCLSWVLLGGRI
jgi:hypothetical protein